jgi:imidazolonepropionase
MSTLLIRNIKTLVQTENAPRGPVRGADMARLPQLNDAWLLADGDKITAFGTMATCPERADRHIDATGRMVFPGWCDSHTHLVFAASREEEFVDRIRGLSYEEIARRGGGILNSARRLTETSETALLERAWERLGEVIRGGTGAIEIKSGYGLSLESELKMLRVVRELKRQSPIPIKATFLGAHAIPEAWSRNREGYIRLVIDDMLPRVAGEGLADYCDVFCDRGFFTPEETDRILKAAARYGLRARIHANELDNSGGVQIGVANKAVSVDHLERIGDAEIKCLAQSDTFPTLLPACAFFLGIPYAPARRLIDAGLPVVLASDYNPGSAPSGRMAFVISLACIKMKMTPEEAVNAATVNGAYALELGREFGSICPGKIANLFITKPLPSVAHLPYAFGSDPVEQIVLNGSLWANASGPQ